MRTLIKNGRIVTAGDFFQGSISIEDGVIQEIGCDISGSFDYEIDAAGKLVMPGGVDVHTHFNLHTGSAVARDDFFAGTVAAACGGTTCVVDHMGFGPAGCSLFHQLRVYYEYAKEHAVIDYSFHGVIQHVNSDILAQLEDMLVQEGIASFKQYMTYDYRLPEADILRLMEKVKTIGGILTIHAENHEIIEYLKDRFIREGDTAPIYHALSRPDYCEADAVNRVISLAAAVGNVPLYIVHLTSALGLKHVISARASGQTVYSETCPQYLLLNEECYNQELDEGLKYILSPPLRKKRDSEALWEGIRLGHIQVIATDHCPFTIALDKQKGRGDFSKCPNGLPGVEERIPLMFSEGVMKGRFSINKMVELCAANPAKIFGMYPKKGALLPGSDGDIVILDPDKEVTLTQSMLHSNADYTAYEGFKLRGYPVMTLSRGEVIVQNNEFIGQKGRGKFVKRQGFSEQQTII
ncbi:MAG: hydA [Clostridia bacterium]|jgi:dihydropyrimidinase|nr:hydA [Clostridia bacterium]